MTADRNSRNIALFGAEGQRRIADTKVTIVGNGGLGAPVAQDLAYLGVLDYRLVDGDVVTTSSLNRMKGATPEHVDEQKVIVIERMIKAIQPTADVTPVVGWLTTASAAIEEADVVFGCLDKDIHRVELIKLCINARVPFFDLATDVDDEHGPLTYGGRVLWSGNAERCPFCMDLLDQDAMRRDSLPGAARADYDRIYGVEATDLDETGPSVVSINGVVASLAVTEFLVWITGLRAPQPLLTYRAERGVVRQRRPAGSGLPVLLARAARGGLGSACAEPGAVFRCRLVRGSQRPPHTLCGSAGSSNGDRISRSPPGDRASSSVRNASSRAPYISSLKAAPTFARCRRRRTLA